jgi:hypothetical protein
MSIFHQQPHVAIHLRLLPNRFGHPSKRNAKKCGQRYKNSSALAKLLPARR